MQFVNLLTIFASEKAVRRIVECRVKGTGVIQHGAVLLAEDERLREDNEIS